MSEPGESRSERRSVRHHAERRRRAGRLFVVAAPAAVVIVIVALLFPFLASPLQQGNGAEGTATTATTAAGTSGAVGTATSVAPAASGGAGSVPANPPGNAVLVVEQDRAPVVLALTFAGPKGGLVLALPAVALLRAGDRFTRAAQLYAPGKPQALVQSLSNAFAVPVGAVASVEWSHLREALANDGIDPLPPLRLDSKGENAGGVAEALAAALGKSGADGGGSGWGQERFAGDTEGFRAAVGAALVAAQHMGWTGQAVTGTLVENGDLIYLEPDIKTARNVVAGIGAGS
jgi:hypothetical protein